MNDEILHELREDVRRAEREMECTGNLEKRIDAGRRAVHAACLIKALYGEEAVSA